MAIGVQTWQVPIGYPPIRIANVSQFEDGTWACDCGQIGLPPESARGRNCEHIAYVKELKLKEARLRIKEQERMRLLQQQHKEEMEHRAERERIEHEKKLQPEQVKISETTITIISKRIFSLEE